MKDVFIIKLVRNLDRYPPPEDISPFFYEDIWTALMKHSEEVKAIYEFERWTFPAWVKSWFIDQKEYPRIYSIGRLSEQSEEELDRISLFTHEGHCDFFYEVRSNKLIKELMKAYSNEYIISDLFFEYWDEDELEVLDNFFNQFDEETKLISFGHDGEPVFIIFFSENLLKEVTRSVKNI